MSRVGDPTRQGVAEAALFGASFWLCALADPVSMAPLRWPMLLTVAAATVAGR